MSILNVHMFANFELFCSLSDDQCSLNGVLYIRALFVSVNFLVAELILLFLPVPLFLNTIQPVN